MENQEPDSLPLDDGADAQEPESLDALPPDEPVAPEVTVSIGKGMTDPADAPVAPESTTGLREGDESAIPGELLTDLPFADDPPAESERLDLSDESSE